MKIRLNRVVAIREIRCSIRKLSQKSLEEGDDETPQAEADSSVAPLNLEVSLSFRLQIIPAPREITPVPK